MIKNSYQRLLPAIAVWGVFSSEIFGFAECEMKRIPSRAAAHFTPEVHITLAIAICVYKKVFEYRKKENALDVIELAKEIIKKFEKPHF